MKKKLLITNLLTVMILLTCFLSGCSNPFSPDENPAGSGELSTAPNLSASSFKGNGRDVILQGFHWNSWQYGTWNIIINKAQTIKDGKFTIVWFPPASKSTGGTGYLPTEWEQFDSAHGSAGQLLNAVNALTGKQIKAMADIVINHRCGTNDWADFSYPAFSNNARAVCHDDEWGFGTGASDSGDGYEAGRDLDHTWSEVRNKIKSWLNNKLKGDLGFSCWRYDYVKGFNPSYVGEYNSATSPYFSVGELWPDIPGNQYYNSGSGVNFHRQKIMDWINGTGSKSTAFDFTTKWQLMLAFDRNEYWRLKDPQGKPIGAIGWWPEMCVTFIDNHDTGPSPGGGQDHWPFPSNKVEEGYAYILTHPGTPSVYWPHYFDWGSTLHNKIKNLIRIRNDKGVTSSSSITIYTADSSKYGAVINGNVAVKIGSGSWYPPGSGWTQAESGSGGHSWVVWTK